MGYKHSLRTFVHRTLVSRLIAVGLTLSLLIGLTHYLLSETGRAMKQLILQLAAFQF